MKPAVPIGTTLEGERVAISTRVPVTAGEVVLGCSWLHGPSVLRGAVVAALGTGCHVDMHGHLGDGTTRQARATVYYRVRDGQPVVFAYGPRAADHLTAVARIQLLRLPNGAEVHVDEATVSTFTKEVGQLKDSWLRYALATPYFPSSVVYARRPRQRGPERTAWAGHALASSIRMWLADVGIEVEGHRQVHVHVEAGDDVEVRWRDRAEAVRWGFNARWTTNVILPDGIGLGQHVSEGFGEVRRCS